MVMASLRRCSRENGKNLFENRNGKPFRKWQLDDIFPETQNLFPDRISCTPRRRRRSQSWFRSRRVTRAPGPTLLRGLSISLSPAFSLSLSLFVSLPHRKPHAQTHTHTRFDTHTHTHTYTYRLTLSLALPLVLSCRPRWPWFRSSRATPAPVPTLLRGAKSNDGNP